jgi:uncharacterized protein
MKRVFIVHGWDDSPESGWYPWLKSSLEKQGFSVIVPALPHAETPTIEDWVTTLAQAVGKADAQTYFVGHSIGCQTIMRYLATLPSETKIGGVVFVAGWFTLQNLESEAVAIAQPWLQTPIDLEKVKKSIGKNVFAIFSPTDHWVPIENKKLFEEKLQAQTFLEDGKGERGHFSGRDGVTEIPKVLELVLVMSATPQISIDDLAKIEIRMGKIVSAEKVENADRLLKFVVDLGEHDSVGSPRMRTIISGVAKFYTPEMMVGKLVPVVTNLAPRKMKGIESQGMILYAIDDTIDPETNAPMHKTVMLNSVIEVPPGSVVQ